MIAYEPVWAIGTGKVPEVSEINENISFINDIIYEKYETKLDILYGGVLMMKILKSYLVLKA